MALEKVVLLSQLSSTSFHHDHLAPVYFISQCSPLNLPPPVTLPSLFLMP